MMYFRHCACFISAELHIEDQNYNLLVVFFLVLVQRAIAVPEVFHEPSRVLP